MARFKDAASYVASFPTSFSGCTNSYTNCHANRNAHADVVHRQAERRSYCGAYADACSHYRTLTTFLPGGGII
jgi:hypothetical protein